MRSEIEKLDELLQKAHGVVCHSMLTGRFSPDQIRAFQDSGRLIRMHRGVYRGAGIEVTQTTRVRAAVLAGGPGTIASHRSAMRLWDFWLPTKDVVEITVPRGRSVRVSGAKVHTSNISSLLVQSVNGIPASSPERTLLEISSMRGDDTARRVLEDVVIRGIVNLDRLLVAYELMRAMGRRRFSVWQRVLPNLPERLEKMATGAEVRGFKAWQAAGMAMPEPQHKIILDGKAHFIDFAYPALKIAIEFDGYITHDILRAARDKKNDRQMSNLGWQVLRFPNDTPDHVIVADVSAALQARAIAS